MSVWEYKVISSGKGGFASPALLEKFLGDLGRDEWEIIHYHSSPDNLLAFSGLARRPTQRDWTLQDAAAAAAKAEADKLRAEFEAKFKAATSNAPSAAEAPPPSFLAEKSAPEDGFRRPVDTSRDADPDEPETEGDDWDKLTAAEADELPSFFEALKPHFRRNQRGPGMSVGVDYLAKKWDQSEDDVKGALIECGFGIPDDEDAKPIYIEYEGDLFWVNVNRRGELWINTKEKPRPVFRVVKGQRFEPPAEEPAPARPPVDHRPAAPATEAPAGSVENAPTGSENTPAAAVASAAPAAPVASRSPQSGNSGSGGSLPQGVGLLAKIKPQMRRSRRGPGGSGSASFLSRALRCSENDLIAAFVACGLVLPVNPNDKPVFIEIGNDLWWLNKDSRGGVWINGREKKPGETVASAAEAEPSPESTPESAPAPTTESAIESAPPTPAPASEPAPAVETAPTPDAAPAPTAAPATEPAPVVPSVLPESAQPSEAPPTPAPTEAATPEVAATASAPVEPSPAVSSDPASPLAALRPRLVQTKTGSFAAKLEVLATEVGQAPDQLLATLTGTGLKVPEKPRERPFFVEHAGEVFWLSRNSKDEFWLNAKTSKFGSSDDEAAEGEKSARRGRSRKKSDSPAESPEGEASS